ncbi:MAG: M18 family aminopeptidase [Gammaproteobacteria bacterium]|nr:M18 family aminopeptidase [Gammaproteobacteria bacterium]
MQQSKFTTTLMNFIQHSPTPFHAVLNMQKILQQSGFIELKEADHWDLLPAHHYYVIRNGSSIIAFRMGNNDVIRTGLRMVGAHTDSPCLKLKPNPSKNRKGYWQLGVEVYGGVLLNPWFDRDLSLAGRVSYVTKHQQLHSCLIDFKQAIAIIPSLAIHLDRNANSSRSINAQENLSPIILQLPETEKKDVRALLKEKLLSNDSKCNVDQVLDYELCFYDTQAPALVGLKAEFISSARLDNLLSCYVGLASLVNMNNSVENKITSLLVCNDHEEVGSVSASGAQGPFLKSVLERIAGDHQKLSRMIDRSYLVSADNAHGVHPNYLDKHDECHGPLMNRGPVIKVNANQRYATNSETSALFRHLCKQAGVPVQSFVVRNDMACGSTIGPITASGIGVKTLDVGVPQLAMHSIREMAGVQDAYYLYKVMREFYGSEVD